jgi:hypothetical protein
MPGAETRRLPYVDEHVREFPAPADRVWSALLHTLGGSFRRLPDPAAAAWGLHPRNRSGRWEESVRPGDTLPGFEVAEVDARHLLVLRGGHRFSEYELRFELDSLTPSGTRLRARTYAAFPGLTGSVYRALVIGSRGHRIAVARMLERVGTRTERLRPV